MTDLKVLFVRIRNAEGKYLGRGERGVDFIDDVRNAVIFDCRRDGVEDQLSEIKRKYGVSFEMETVDPREIYETCDRCGRLALAFQMFFDGAKYWCRDCRTNYCQPMVSI